MHLLTECCSMLKARFPAYRYHGTYNRTYFAYLARDGNSTIYINYYDHPSATYGTAVAIATNIGSNDIHSSPVVHVIESGTYAGYILVAFSNRATSGWPLKIYRSSAPETITGTWTSNSYTGEYSHYPQFVQLGDGNVAIFYMFSPDAAFTYGVKYRLTTDGGSTFGAAVIVIAASTNHTYPSVISKGNAVHLAMNYRTTDYFSVYYVYSPDNLATWRTQGDPTPLSLPIASTSAELVYSHVGTWVMDIQVDGAGSPVIAFADYVDATTALAKWAHYHDAAWSVHSTGVNTLIYDATTHYIWANTGIFIDPQDTTHVFICAKIGATLYSNLQEWHTTDGGATWAKVADITQYSGVIVDEARPVVNYMTDFRFFFNVVVYCVPFTTWYVILYAANFPQITIRCAENTPQVYWNGAWVFALNGTYGAWVGNYNGITYASGGGYRFQGVAVPPGVVIKEARLIFTSYNTLSATIVNSKIVGDKEPNAAAFSTLANYQSRRGTSCGGANNNLRTVAEVAWDAIAAWTLYLGYMSPEIKDVIQEIIFQGGWASGNAMVLFWDDHDHRSSAAAYRWPDGYYYPGSAPILIVDYKLPARAGFILFQDPAIV